LKKLEKKESVVKRTTLSALWCEREREREKERKKERNARRAEDARTTTTTNGEE
tara:strand:- start:1663 stop:1824 length:162 start_codon:yes stop_codon:yes gene_type:complete